jgi:hypothetical protein
MTPCYGVVAIKANTPTGIREPSMHVQTELSISTISGRKDFTYNRSFEAIAAQEIQQRLNLSHFQLSLEKIKESLSR